nr:alpha/beta hydrolase [Bacillus sp. FJAT-47783]
MPNGETIGYRERDGGQQVVLLVHGNMISSYHWDLAFEHLDERFKLYAIDLRGQGTSTYVTPIGALKDFATDIKLFVDALKLSSFSVVGWSMGGGISMQFAADYPEYVEKLVLLSSMSTRGYPLYKVNSFGKPILTERLQSKEEIRKDRARYIPMTAAYRSKNTVFLRQILNATMYSVKKPDRLRYRAYMEDILQQRNLLDVYDAMNRFNISHHHNGLVEGTKEVDRIKAPTLVLWGDKDLIVTYKMQKEILEDVGDNASFTRLRKVGHSPLVDDIETFSQVLLHFLGE